jgi:DNA ligase-1
MKAFTELYTALEDSNRTNDKVKALVSYFGSAPPRDSIWAITLLTGRRPKRPVNSTKVVSWAIELSGIPVWLFQECYDAVGDMSETISLILDKKAVREDISLADTIEKIILPLKNMSEEEQRNTLQQLWLAMEDKERFLFNKLIGGSFRVGVSQNIVVRALAKYSGIEEQIISHRLMGNWEPTAESYAALVSADSSDADHSRPYPFSLAYALDIGFEELGKVDEWQAEWKWDGIRAQLIKRNNEVFIWSRGEDLMTDRFPEIAALGKLLPNGTVLDGELVAWSAALSQPMPFSKMQLRIGRKTVGKKLLENVPVAFIAYDILELAGEDIRPLDLSARRAKLEELVKSIHLPGTFIISPVVDARDWEHLSEIRGGSRENAAEGLMLKRRSSAYRVGRKRGDWWKWKVEPFTVDAVLIYAQRGSGKRASLYTDYTFGLWNEEGKLVSFAKAYSGLTDEEIRKADAFIRRNTLEKFGPVRTVKPELVFELAFEGIQLSGRHKSGIAVRFPRIARWRHDKKPEDADKLEEVKKLVQEITP